MTLPSGARPAPGALFTFTAGFVLALVVCAAILAQRVSHGSVNVAVVAHIVLTSAVMLFAYSIRRCAEIAIRTLAPRIGLQIVGAAIGITVAHIVLQGSELGAAPWLSERPQQLVNDAVAVFAPIALVWAAMRRPPNTLALVTTLLVVTAYRLTGAHWHLDQGVFRYTVQELVSIQLAAAALGVTLFHVMVPA